MFLLTTLLISMAGVLGAQTGVPDYGGPAIASRAGQKAGTRGAEAVNLRIFGNVLGNYSSGLVAASLNDKGEVVDPGGMFGLEANVGAYGTKSWKRTSVGLDYRGNYRHYPENAYFDGSDHLLSLDFGAQTSRRTNILFRTMSGTSSRAVGGVLGFVPNDPSLIGIPTAEIFDNRSYFLEGDGNLSIQFGRRNSLQLGSAGYAVRRQSRALVGLNGFAAYANLARRVSRRTTVGLSYQYMHFDYPRAFGEADNHVLMANYSRQLNRYWSLNLAAGANYSDFVGVRRVTLDPLIAELLGRSTGREAFNAINLTPAGFFALTRAQGRTSLSFIYQRANNGGNGILLFSRQETATINWTYNGSRRWSIGTNVQYSKMSGYGTYNGNFELYGGGSSFNYLLWKDLHFTSSLYLRQLKVMQSGFDRFGTQMSVGLTYSPGPIPVLFR